MMFHSIKAGYHTLYDILARILPRVICYDMNVTLQKSEIFDERINLVKNSRVLKKQLLRKNLR